MLFNIEFDVTVFDVPVFDVTHLYHIFYLHVQRGIKIREKKVHVQLMNHYHPHSVMYFLMDPYFKL